MVCDCYFPVTAPAGFHVWPRRAEQINSLNLTAMLMCCNKNWDMHVCVRVGVPGSSGWTWLREFRTISSFLNGIASKLKFGSVSQDGCYGAYFLSPPILLLSFLAFSPPHMSLSFPQPSPHSMVFFPSIVPFVVICVAFWMSERPPTPRWLGYSNTYSWGDSVY